MSDTRPASERGSRVTRVSRRGAARWVERLHPWIYRSDVLDEPGPEPGAVDVIDERGRPIGSALWSPASTISLRMLSREPATIDAAFWRDAIGRAADFRASLGIRDDAMRIVHAEADGLPSLVVDRYADILVVQFLSAGIERYRDDITAALTSILGPTGIIARDDVPIRRHERLESGIAVLHGTVPETVEVHEADVRWRIAPSAGQKTGAFLDQRDNRQRARTLARGRALDCFAYHGSFALQMARAGAHVTAVDSSADALLHARENARINDLETAIDFVEANAFDVLREYEERGERFDVIVLDPPAFARRRDNIEAALRGYKEINLRAMRLLEAGGHLLTFSCSYHVSRTDFGRMLENAAADARRGMRFIEWRGQAADHPEIVQIPETAYLKGAILQAR